MADPLLEAALSSQSVTIFGATRIDMTGIGGRSGPLCLLDGAAQVTIGGEIYYGKDEFFGAIDSIDAVTDTDGEEAPNFSISLHVPSASAAAGLSSPAMQGREVRVIVGALNPTTGLIIGQPELKRLGEIDVSTLSISQGRRTLDLDCNSVFERFFEIEEGARMQDGWHQSFHPGELGFYHVNGANKNLYWGGKRPSGAYTSAVSYPSGPTTAAQRGWIAQR